MSDLQKIKTETLEPVKPIMTKMGISSERFYKEAGFVCQIWNDPKNSYLRNSTKESLLSAVASIAQTGLTLNPVAKQAYLIPRKIKDGKNWITQAHLEPSYIGLMKLLTDAGQVLNLQTNLVYEGDEFDVNLGMETHITHKPHYITGQKKGDIKGVYSIANIKGGLKQFEYMTIQEIHEIRGTSESYKVWEKNHDIPCVWIKYEGEMIRKTCIKRISKHLPRSEQFDYADNLSNKDFEMTFSQITYIEALLHSSSLPESMKEDLENQLGAMTYADAKKTIEYLKENQNIKILDDINRPAHLGPTEATKEFDRKLQED
ncbi:MAG: recombinase RecT [Ignavibacteriaceae bacterium]